MSTTDHLQRTHETELVARFRTVAEATAAALDSDSARSFRSYTRRYLALVEAANLDPLSPDRHALVSAINAAGLRGQAPWKLRWVARTVATQLRVAAEAPGGLGLGRTEDLLAELQPGVLADAVEAVVHDYARPAVARSAIGRLLMWANETGIGAVELSAGDLPDFDLWLRARTGRRQSEILVVARRVCRALDQLGMPPSSSAARGEARTPPRRWTG